MKMQKIVEYYAKDMRQRGKTTIQSVTTAKYRNAFVATYFNSKYASRKGIKNGIEEGKIIATELNR